MKPYIKNVGITIVSERYDSSEALSQTLDKYISAEKVEPPEPQCERTEFYTEGTLETGNGKVSLKYDDNMLLGDEHTSVELYFEAENTGLVSIFRNGSVSTALVFENGKRHISVYKTPYFPIEICVNTKKMKNELLTSGIIELEYTVEFHGMQAELTKLTVTVSNILKKI